MFQKEFEIFESKLKVLNSFVVQLKETGDEKCVQLGEALGAVLRSGGFDEIETAFEWCREEYLKLNGPATQKRD